MHDDGLDQPGAAVSYRIERLIGVGGAAAVYEARRLGRSGPGERVACKVLHQSRRGEPLHRALMWREAVLGLRCTPGHANLVEFLDFLDDAEERLCIVMELVDGASVAELRRPDPRLPFPVTRRIAVDVLEALAHLHGRGVLHRDLSPGNILVSADGVVKVADFGLARLMEQGQVHTAKVRGTPMYVSPETVEILPLDARSDLFSLAAILFDLVAGMPPCGHQQMIGAMLARNGAGLFEPLPPDTPLDLAELITGLLRKDREERRPRTAAEALTMLRSHDQPIASPEGLAVLVESAQSRREAELATERPPHVLAPGHVLAQRMTLPGHADSTSPERKPEGAVEGSAEVLPARPAGEPAEVLPARVAGDAVEVLPARLARDAAGDAARPAAGRAAGGAVNPLPDLVAYFGSELMARLVDEIGDDPQLGQMIEIAANALPDRLANNAADAPLDRGAERATDAVPEHIDDALPDGMAGSPPASGSELAAEALPDRAADGASGGALHRRSRLGPRVAARRALAVAIVASALVLGFMLGDRRRGERGTSERPQPPELSAPVAGPLPLAPAAPVPVMATPGRREQTGAMAESHQASGRMDGPRGKRVEARRRARLFGPAPTPWEPVPLGGEPPPWGAP